MMTIKDCIQYEEKKIQEIEVIKILETFDSIKTIPDYIYNDILWLLNKKELTYLYYYKEKDERTPLIVKIFKEFDIPLQVKNTYVKLKDKKTYIKVMVEIV